MATPAITFPRADGVTAVGRVGYRNAETGVELQKWVTAGLPVEWLVIVPARNNEGHRIWSSHRTRREAREAATRYVVKHARPALAQACRDAHLIPAG